MDRWACALEADDGADGQGGVGGALQVNKSHLGWREGQVSQAGVTVWTKALRWKWTGHACGQLGQWGRTGEGHQSCLERCQEEPRSQVRNPSSPSPSL